MLFLPFACACGLIYGPRRKQLLLAAVMFAGFAVVMLPWWARNYRVTGHFVPTTLQVGASLYDGWNPQATGASDMRFVPEFVEAQHNSDANRAESDGFEYRLDRRFRQAAWDWARENPGRVLQLAAVKFADLEFLAQRTFVFRLAGADGGAGDLPAVDVACRLGSAAGDRLAGRIVLAAGGLLYALAHGLREFDSLSATSPAGIDCVGGRLPRGMA